jgi:hypothetical protein
VVVAAAEGLPLKKEGLVEVLVDSELERRFL